MSAYGTRANLFPAGAETPATAKTEFATLWDFIAQRLAAGTTGAGTASAAELQASRQSLGVKLSPNYVINAGGLVQQLTTVPTLTASYAYGGVDMMMAAALSGTGVSGSNGALANSTFASGTGYGAVAASWTTGQAAVQHRFASKNVARLNSKQITVSGKVYHDFGTSRTCEVLVVKPTALDNHASQTTIATSSGFAVASATGTAFSFTTTLGASDATNGLAVIVRDNATNTVASKNFIIGDLLVELGGSATVFDVGSYEQELHACQRYYRYQHFAHRFVATAGGQVGTSTASWPTMYKAPTAGSGQSAPGGSGSTVNASSSGFQNLHASGADLFVTATAAGDCYAVGYVIPLDARL